MQEYQSFLENKRRQAPPAGIDVTAIRSPHLFDWQSAVVAWALRRGKAAVFSDTGTGKTRMQVAWADVVARHTGGNVLLVAPLAVAQQTIREAAVMDISLRYARAQHDVQPGITITNYDMLHAFDLEHFSGIVLDESSIIKNIDGKIRLRLQESCAGIPYRLCCTATPAPNDYTELGSHAAFLGVCTHQEMLATYFIHDGGSTQDWRLKGHAKRDFWRWVASWSVMLRTPRDIGYETDAYTLPDLCIHEQLLAMHQAWVGEQGYLFAPHALSLTQSRRARRAGIDRRVQACADLVNNTPDQWLVWCGLNEEGDKLGRMIPDAVQVAGADTREHKERSLLAFADGRIRVLITKSKVAGFGLNFQRCHQMAFVGIDYSYESFYQAVRRCWRFGQQHPVDVQLFLAEQEYGVLDALRKKEAAAGAMMGEMVAHMAETMRANLADDAVRVRDDYAPGVPMLLPDWLEVTCTY
jgi:hypothetical protein